MDLAVLSATGLLAEMIPDRLYWASRSSTPPESDTIHFFNTDQTLRYEAFYSDFGPLNLAQLYRYCKLLEARLSSPSLADKKIVHVTGEDGRKRSNSAFLIASFLVVCRGIAPDDAWRPFERLAPPPFVPFRDASQGPCTFGLSVLDCVRGVGRGLEGGCFRYAEFDVDDYEFYEKVENGDYNVISPKFIAFSSPSATKTEIYPGVHSMVPADYFDLWKRHNVTAVVRLSKKTYDRMDFIRAGFNHYDLYFADGSIPPDMIAHRFLEVCEAERGCVAVHCKAGLGRTGTLIGLYFMKHLGWSALDFIAWNRIVRPGSVIGPQQAFLKSWEGRMWAAGRLAGHPWAAASRPPPAPLAYPPPPAAGDNPDKNAAAAAAAVGGQDAPKKRAPAPAFSAAAAVAAAAAGGKVGAAANGAAQAAVILTPQ